MEIRQFDKMAEQDRNEYIADLIQGAEDVLNDRKTKGEHEHLNENG